MRTTTRQRGLTLIELLLSMAVVTVGMLGLFRVLVVAHRGLSSGQRFLQAQSRAQLVIEAMRAAPTGVLACLAGSPAAQWGPCETSCLATLKNMGGVATAADCVFVTLANAGHGAGDATGQKYAIVYDPAAGALADRSSWVRANPVGRVYDVQIAVGWNDNGTAPGLPFDHRVVYRTALYK